MILILLYIELITSMREESEHRHLTLAIDFDGTIVEHKFPAVGEFRDGAKKYINKLYDGGHCIIINTCRTDDYAERARAFLDTNGVKYHWLNENSLETRMVFKFDPRKLLADIYIDDRNLGGLPEWEEIYDRVTSEARGFGEDVWNELNGCRDAH